MNIILRKWTRDDAEIIKDLCNAVDLRYLTNRIPHPYTLEDANWYLDYVASRDEKGSLFYAIEVDGKVVGTVSVEGKTDVMEKDAEIGYYILEEYYNQGIMTEAVKQLVKEAFEKLDICRLSASVYAPNIGSQRVLEKNGFQREGIIRQGVYKNGNIYDMYLYGKLKGE